MGPARRPRRQRPSALPLAALLCLLGPGMVWLASHHHSPHPNIGRQELGPPLLAESDQLSAAASGARRALLKVNALRPANASDLAEAGRLLARRRAALHRLLLHDNAVRRAWRERLAAAAPRGVVVCAGGPKALVGAFVGLHVLVHTLGCTLPITIMHWGRDEVATGTTAFFAHHLPGVRFMDMSAPGLYPAHHRPLREALPGQEQEQLALPLAYSPFGFQLKALSLYLAPYREVLYLDADNMALEDPEPLFSLDAFARQGNLFFPDYWRTNVSLWDHLGLQAMHPWLHNRSAWDATRDGGVPATLAEGNNRELPPAPMQTESGQILIDRARHWESLEWALFLNTNADFVYRLPGVYGDKDTFRAAFALAGSAAAYRQAPHPPGVAVVDHFSVNATHPVEPRWRFAGMVQLHPDGRPLFHHRTAESKLPGAGARSQVSGPLTHVSAPASEAQALQATFGWLAGWGLSSLEATPAGCGETCKCSLEAVWEVDRACGIGELAGRAPLALVEVAPNSGVHRASTAAADALALMPFQRRQHS